MTDRNNLVIPPEFIGDLGTLIFSTAAQTENPAIREASKRFAALLKEQGLYDKYFSDMREGGDDLEQIVSDIISQLQMELRAAMLGGERHILIQQENCIAGRFKYQFRFETGELPFEPASIPDIDQHNEPLPDFTKSPMDYTNEVHHRLVEKAVYDKIKAGNPPPEIFVAGQAYLLKKLPDEKLDRIIELLEAIVGWADESGTVSYLGALTDIRKAIEGR